MDPSATWLDSWAEGEEKEKDMRLGGRSAVVVERIRMGTGTEISELLVAFRFRGRRRSSGREEREQGFLN